MPLSSEPIQSRRYDRLTAHIFDTAAALGAKAAEDLAAILEGSIARRGVASVVVATGNSQLEFMAALRRRRDVEWGKVLVFHMDEYLGMSDRHPASFRRYIQEKLTDVVRPRVFFGILGDTRDVAGELRRYTGLLREYPPDACVMGIGENGHLAFNDPPADFSTAETIHVVRLDDACRMQQVSEGHFATLEEVPDRALSLTVPTLLSARRLLVVVPERRKAAAVAAASEGPVTPDCPASILQRQSHACLYLDRESSSLLAN